MMRKRTILDEGRSRLKLTHVYLQFAELRGPQPRRAEARYSHSLIARAPQAAARIPEKIYVTFCAAKR